jgi:hypothetical protein
MLRRNVLVHVKPQASEAGATCGNSFTTETHEFVGTVYAHEGDDSRPADRWYLASDLKSYFQNAYGDEPAFLRNPATSKPWQYLVRRYNTTLQGLSYQVRDLAVMPDSRFVNAETLKAQSGREFE